MKHLIKEAKQQLNEYDKPIGKLDTADLNFALRYVKPAAEKEAYLYPDKIVIDVGGAEYEIAIT